MLVNGCSQFKQFIDQNDANYSSENQAASYKQNQEVVDNSSEVTYEEIYIYKTPKKENAKIKEEVAKPIYSLETSLRCSVDVKNKDVITTIPFKSEAFEIYRLNAGDALPRYEVTGYTFQDKPANEVFKNLLLEAGIKVVATEQYYPSISSNTITGELTKVMDSIAAASDIYYTYDAKRKTLYLNRYEQLVFKVPNKELVLPVLDALQGSGIQDISIDWVDNSLIFQGDRFQEEKALTLIALLDKEPKLAFYDVTVYHIVPNTINKKVDWTSLINAYGTNNIKSGDEGTIGKILVTGHIVNQKTLLSLLNTQASVFQVAQGEFSVPNNWRSRFDIWNCGNVNISKDKLAILAQVEIKNNQIYSKLGIDTLEGEVSSFNATNRLDENIVLFGIPSKSLGYANEGETLILLTPKIVDMVKEM